MLSDFFMDQERLLEKEFTSNQVFRLKIGDETIAETDGEDAVEADSGDINEDDGNWQNANPALIVKRSASKNEEPKIVRMEIYDEDRQNLPSRYLVGHIVLVRGEDSTVYVGKIRRLSKNAEYVEIERGSAVGWVKAWQVVDHVV